MGAALRSRKTRILTPVANGCRSEHHLLSDSTHAIMATKSLPDHMALCPVTLEFQKMPQNDILGTCRSVSDFEKLNRVGEGTYGIVYRAKDLKSGEIVALKKIRMEKEKEGIPVCSVREIGLLMKLRNR